MPRPRPSSTPASIQGVVCAALLAVLALMAAAPAAGASPVAAQPVTIDSSGLVATPSGLSLSVARDGTGGLVYLRRDAGGMAEHVYLSRLTAGAFQAPVELDAGLAGATAAPAVAAGNGGVLLVAFPEGGGLYVTDVPSATAALPAPRLLVGGGSRPSLSMNNLGKANLAFTVPDGAGSDVRTAFFARGSWSVGARPLNVTAGDDAGTAGSPVVTTAGDGLGLVVWEEQGHLFSRRVNGITPSAVTEQVDAPLPGCSQSAVDEPQAGTQGDSSYADVVFRETVSCGYVQGSPTQTRVLLRRLRGSQYDDEVPIDGIPQGSPASAGSPAVAVNEYGRGFATAVRQDTGDVIATPLGTNGAPGGPHPINGEPDATPPPAVPALAGLISDFVTWQHDPGSSGASAVVLRYARDGLDLGPETTLSQPAGGAVDAADGLTGAGDVQGDAVAAWLQGSPGAEDLVAEQLYQPPLGFVPQQTFAYSRSSRPVLSWQAAQEPWGPVTYTVTVDGNQVASTTATRLQLPAPLSDGIHSWGVTATNPVGQTSSMSAAAVWVDTVAPHARITVTGRLMAGSLVHVQLTAIDPPRGTNPAAASGISRLILSLGDGSEYPTAGRFHIYARAGAYRVSAIVEDRAGNVGFTSTLLRIRPRPRPHPRRPAQHPRKARKPGHAIDPSPARQPDRIP